MQMNDYIVRIYRRDPKNPQLMIGIVEEVGVTDQKIFHNQIELLTLLGGQADKLVEYGETGGVSRAK